MKRVVYVLLLISLVNNRTQAQVPGFMGKKIAVGYNLDIGFPILRDVVWKQYNVQSDYEGNNGNYFLYPRHNVTLEYAVGKQISVEAGMGFSKSGLLTYEQENDMLRYEYPGLSSYYDSEPYNASKSYDYMRVNNRMYRIGFNLFNGHYIAPHGNYWNFSYIQNQGTIQYVLNGAASDLSKVTNHGFMITKGYRRIILSSVIVDIGFGFGYVFAEKKSTIEGTEMTTDEILTITQMQTSTLNSSLSFNGHIGIKYLIPKF